MTAAQSGAVIVLTVTGIAMAVGQIAVQTGLIGVLPIVTGAATDMTTAHDGYLVEFDDPDALLAAAEKVRSGARGDEKIGVKIVARALEAPIRTIEFNENVTVVRGSHQVKMGFNYRYGRNIDDQNNQTGGVFSFGNRATAFMDDPGEGLAEMLLGFVGSASINDADILDRRLDYFGMFIQDDFRVSSKLTLNLGLRYDKNDGVDGGGSTVADDSRISPRLGVSWDVNGDGNWVVNASAARYVIAPYFKHSSIPFVFCGINWSADEYGFPTDNITGMLEIISIDQLLKVIRTVNPDAARGIFIGGDVPSTRSNYERYKKIFSGNEIAIDDGMVTTFREWENIPGL